MGFWQFATGGGSGGGTGDVVGPASSTDNAVARWNLATGKLLQDSALTVSDVAGGVVTLATTAGNALAVLNTAPTAAAGASVAGDPLTVTAGAAVASTDTDGAAAGGSVTITGGAAARRTSGNANGGDVLLVGGAGIGTGTQGVVKANGTQVVVGSTGATDNAILRADGTGGATAQASVVTIADTTGLMSFPDFALKGGSGELSVRNTNDTQYTTINVFSQNWWNTAGTTRAGIFYQTGKYLGLVSDYQFTWSNSATESVGPDTGLGRIAAGQVAVSNATNGMANNIKIATTTVNATGATSTASNLVPAGCILLGVTTRVTTAITSGDGGTSVNIGNGTDADMYGAAIAFALGTTTNLASHTASALAFVSAAQNVVFTCVGGTFATGQWRVCAHYLDLTAPTS